MRSRMTLGFAIFLAIVAAIVAAEAGKIILLCRFQPYHNSDPGTYWRELWLHPTSLSACNPAHWVFKLWKVPFVFDVSCACPEAIDCLESGDSPNQPVPATSLRQAVYFGGIISRQIGQILQHDMLCLPHHRLWHVCAKSLQEHQQ